MLTFEKFAGINNVVPEHRRQANELTVGVNVDIGLSGDITRRAGYTLVSDVCHKNVWQADGFMLSTVDGNDLVAIDDAGDETIVAASVGTARVWYCNLPDGRVAYSNGALCGIASATGSAAWGVPRPGGLGGYTDVAGSLLPGTYRYQLTHVRLADGLEGAPTFGHEIALTGGVVFTGLPALAGHKINVYLAGVNGDAAFLAGSTENSTFSYTGPNEALLQPCRTEFLDVAPAGRCLAFWRGRALVANGSVLYASLPGSWEHFDLRRDFKQFSADITAVIPVDGGVFVGTETELAFLAGLKFDELAYSQSIAAGVVLGSGVAVDGEMVGLGKGVGSGGAMLCIADGQVVAGLSDGSVARLTQGRYKTSATEVAATFRQVGDIPQYIAIPL